ncbi:hypothetical protein GCM10027413_10680 [Conyzicola nivalis]|uniref:Uncharacterized protein n=1 Tax=Conyzicola nivalis TaxID=1477021 RepID=A0A916SI87_9MICO|nr:hypothetical protein [Conyzicola nivalis]GGB02154.1 hypothetical protein GCM10010979_15950 [Conyzicola nivalis]
MTETDNVRTGRRLGWAGLAVALLFALFFAYDLWEAIQNAIELPKLYAQLEAVGLPAGDVPWLLIAVGIAIPPLAYVVAFVAGRRHTLAMKALIFLLALVAVAALSLSVNALAVA